MAFGASTSAETKTTIDFAGIARLRFGRPREVVQDIAVDIVDGIFERGTSTETGPVEDKTRSKEDGGGGGRTE
ncbi:hypothetical protein E4U09_000673 [Claviceps aff. purpurea]|uniref:Uncharacterized protein n=1 Tax=Claviceps aff. purpurea TaxID=1967640 RepID=A0A9P7QT99_9HYPO|nr:hypothetical protein E4U09_000673 [Claviceps aff. purpurea]